jgi:hypothetical protein
MQFVEQWDHSPNLRRGGERDIHHFAVAMYEWSDESGTFYGGTVDER